MSHHQSDLAHFEALIEAAPPQAKVKGMYINSSLDNFDLRRMPRPTSKRYVTFKDYPLQEYMEILVRACPLLYPECCTREALTRQGRLVYPTLANSTVGRIIFSLAGRNWTAALPLVSRGYEISLNPGSATLRDLSKNGATVELRDVYNFADSYQVGVMEGAMETFLVSGQVHARKKERDCDVDLVMSWE